jgi:cytochrome c oxidase cbb3-type subunit 2
MNRGPLIFLGVFLTFLAGWVLLVASPYYQFERVEPFSIEGTNEEYPRPFTGLALQGMRVYQREGCVYCHSQQVRAENFGTDIARGWGERRSVPRDYIKQQPVLLGTSRTGPDLANIGVRQPDDTWHLLHLYDPQITSPGSIMPPYRFLFIQRKIDGRRSPDALNLQGPFAPPEGYEVVPTDDAKALVAYLKQLKQDVPLEEANR